MKTKRSDLGKQVGTELESVCVLAVKDINFICSLKTLEITALFSKYQRIYCV